MVSLSVKCSSGTTFEVEAELSMTVLEFKEKLVGHASTPAVPPSMGTRMLSIAKCPHVLSHFPTLICQTWSTISRWTFCPTQSARSRSRI